MVTIMDIETTSAPRTESISACTTVGTVAISVAHATAQPASQDITMDIIELATAVAVETSVVAAMTATSTIVLTTEVLTTAPITEVSTIAPITEALTIVPMVVVVAATSTVVVLGTPHAMKVM